MCSNIDGGGGGEMELGGRKVLDWIVEDRTQVVTTFPDARSLSGLGVPAREDRRTAHTDGQIGCLGGVTLPT
jgi:hypothetical protein